MISILLLTSSAFAWKHTGHVWSRDELPLKWYLSDYVAPMFGTDGEDNPADTYQYELINTSYNNWVEGAPCGQLSHEFVEVYDGHHETGRDNSDQRNVFYFDDPNDEQGGGVLGVTYTQSTPQIAFNRDGRLYRYAFDSDIVFSSDVNWIQTSDLATDCSGTPIEAVATHEIGHQWGMGHSCEENEVSAGLCEEQDLRNANMFWAAPQCLDFNPDQVFTDDDVQGMTALYGPYATFEASEETPTYGGVPLEVCFELSSSSAVSEVEWLYGDGEGDTFGTESEELYNTCHTYTEKGQYTINVTIRGESDSCDEWEYTNRERAMVVVCEEPTMAAGFDDLFTYEPVEDLTIRLINQADTTVYGCIDQIQWEVYKGDELIRSLNAWSPKVDFSEEGAGEYTVKLILGGPGGTTESEAVKITVEEYNADSCSVVSSSSVFALFFSLFGITRRRRN